MRAGQPDKNEGDDAGLVGRPRVTFPLVALMIHKTRRALRLCRGCNETRYWNGSRTR